MSMFFKISLNILIFSFFSASSLTFAEYLNFFSPRDNVNFHINRAINGANQSIDITIGDIKSKEIADALVQAKKRSVTIRILFSKKGEINSKSQLKYLLENGINAWVLDDRSIDLNSFIIFDKKLLLIGSFSMDEKDFQSITFTDEQASLQQYQVRFDGFTNLKLLPAKNVFSEKPSQAIGKGDLLKDKIPSHIANQVPAAQRINLSFEEMFKIFGKGSRVSKSERKNFWRQYKGKYVTWKGHIKYIAWGLFTGSIMGVSHPLGKDVIVYIRDQYEQNVKRMHKGDPIVYCGRLVKVPTLFNGFKLRDAIIISQPN